MLLIFLCQTLVLVYSSVLAYSYKLSFGLIGFGFFDSDFDGAFGVNAGEPACQTGGCGACRCGGNLFVFWVYPLKRLLIRTLN
jgi:hypothetical protein